MATEELGQPLRCGHRSLYVQEVAGALQRELVNLREPGAEQLRALTNKRSLFVVPRTETTGWAMEAACSGPNVHALRAGRSMPKKKSASSSAWSAPPGTRSSITARHELTPLSRNPERAGQGIFARTHVSSERRG